MSLRIGETLIPGIRVHQTTGTGAGNYQQKTAVPSLSQQIITADSGYDALSRVTIAAMSAATQATPSLSIDTTTGVITATSTQTAGYVAAGTTTDTLGLSTITGTTITPTNNVQVAVSANKYTLGQIQVAAVPSETRTITANGTYTPSFGKWFSSVTVNVPTGTIVNNEPNRTVTPGVTQQIITPASGYNGLSQVTVNAISPINTTSDLIIAANTVTVPAGYYETNVIGTVDNAVLGSITTSRTKSNGKLVTTSTYSNFSAGFLASHSNVVTEQTLQTETVTPNKNTQTITPTNNNYYLESVTVNPIPSQYIIPSGSQNITVNDTYDVTGLAEVVVNVPIGSTIHNQNKTVDPSESVQSIIADSGYSGLGTVTVNAISSTYIGSDIPQRTWNVTSSWNETLKHLVISAQSGYYSSDLALHYEGKTLPDATITISDTGLITSTTTLTTSTRGVYKDQSKATTSQLTTQAATTVTPTESEQTIVAAGKYTLGAIKVAAISSTYIGSGITQRSSTDLTLSERVVTAPAGYYANNASYEISSESYSNLLIAYDDDPRYYSIKVDKSGWYNVGTKYVAYTTLPSSTITVDNSGLITSSLTINNGVYKAQTKNTTSQLTVQAATTYTPTTTNQTIAAGKYLTGIQTILGDENLIADNIKSGVTIFGVLGTHVGGSTINNQNKTVTPSTSQQTITYDSGYTGLGTVTVEAIPIISNYTISNVNANFYTENGTRKWRIQPNITSSEDGYLHFQRYLSITGNYSTYQALASNTVITPTETQQTVGGSSWMMEGAITINAIPSTYVGSGITQRSSTDLTVSGATITVPAGYYSTEASKSVATMNLSESSTSSGELWSTIRATSTMTYINFSEGYNATARYARIWAYNQSKTVTPSGTTQSITADSGYSGLSTVTVTGDSDLIAENIKDGVSIFGVTGTYTGTTPTIRELTITPSENTQTYDGAETLISQASKFSGSSTRTLSTPLTIGATYTVKYYEATESQTMSGNLTPTWVGTFVCAATQNLDSNKFTLTTTTVTFNNNSWDYYGVEIYTPAADGFLPVTVNPIPSNYVIPTGTLNITSNNTYDVSNYASAVVNIPVSTTTLQAKTNINPSTSSQTITPDSGYDGLSSVQINAMPSGTATAPTTLTISSPTRGTTGASLKLTANVSITPRITTAGYISTGTAGTTAVTINTGIAMKYATTYTPTTSDQTIATGYYIAGVQTIKGDSNLSASNIKNGVSIFGVTGNYTGGTITIEPLTVTPTENQQVYPVGTNMTVIATRNKQGDDDSGETTWTIDLASIMTNGEAFNITGTLWTYFSGGQYAQANIDETFIWDGQSHTFTTTGTKTTGNTTGTVTYTVTVNTNNIVTTLSAPSTWTSYGPAIAKNITISKGVAYPDGYGPVTVNAIPSTYKNLIDTTTAVAADIAEGATAYTSKGILLTGSMHVVTYYTGTIAPASSLGQDGDIYLRS